MQINWKSRFQHGPFLVGLFALVILLVQQVAALFGYTVEGELTDKLTDTFNTILMILVAFGIVSDPTTKGVNDSDVAMTYTKPKDTEGLK